MFVIKFFFSLLIMGNIYSKIIPLDKLSVADELILTIPNSGTNLLLKLVSLIDEVNGLTDSFADHSARSEHKRPLGWRHLWKSSLNDPISLGPTPGKVDFILRNNIKILIIVRDPRDVANTLANKKSRKTYKLEYLDEVIKYPGLVFIKNNGSFPYFKKFKSFTILYNEYLGWQNYPFVYTASFEKLIGPQGGGSKKLQLQEIMNIASHIGKPISLSVAKEISAKLFGGTNTFRKGQIEAWRKDFTEKQKEAFLLKEGALLERLGYPID